MSCLMLLPVVLLVFGLAGSLVVLWKRSMEIGVRDANTSHVTSPASLVRRCFTSGQHTIAGLVRGSPARVYAGDSCRSSEGTTMPDGFQSGITLTLTAFLSKVSPQNDTLLITFDSSDQSAAAKAVLDKNIAPHGYIMRSRTITVRLCSG